jgi:hypothetical protein
MVGQDEVLRDVLKTLPSAEPLRRGGLMLDNHLTCVVEA